MIPIMNLSIDASASTPKYLQLANAIENWILHEQIPAGARLPSGRQIAQRYNLTVVTANKGIRELQNRGLLSRRVGSGTYVATERRSMRIGLLCHEPIMPDNCYVSPLLRTLYGFWRDRGYDVVPLQRQADAYETAFAEYALAGMVVFDADDTGIAAVRALRARGMPLVALGVTNPGDEPELFGLSAREIAQGQIRYLAGLGHSRIGMLGSFHATYNLGVRETELIRGMWEVELPFNPDWLISVSPNAPLAEHEAFLNLMRRPDRPTALLVLQHGQVLPLYEALRRMGLRVPHDVSVLGLDDPDYAAQLSPPLTVFRQPIERMTADACEQLRRIIDREAPMPKPRYAAECVERGSCRRLRADGTAGRPAVPDESLVMEGVEA